MKEKIERLETERSALLEIFRHLRTTSTQDTQALPDFIRCGEPLDIPSLTQLFHTKHLQDQAKQLRALQDDALERTEPDLQNTQQQSQPSYSAESSDTVQDLEGTTTSFACIPISAVCEAVDMFLRSAGALFYVFTKMEGDAIIEEVFGVQSQSGLTDVTKLVREAATAPHRAQLAELCGMAAVGLLYLPLSQQQNEMHTAESANLLYSMTRLMLEDAIKFNPLRAMKICALLAMYNIVLKGVVALAYIGIATVKQCS